MQKKLTEKNFPKEVLENPAPVAAPKMDPEKIRKKMAFLSVEEKVQFATTMTQQMGIGPKALAPESKNTVGG